VSHPSDLGMNVIINKTHLGLIFNQDLYKDISVGDKLKGIVKKVRPGNKIDITLEKIGYRNIEPNAKSILELLENNEKGYLNLTDKSSPEVIKSTVQMSKKSFKKAVGTLYKQRRIRIEHDGIYLIN
jgi:predicted RNA-binding protein (virulence factor B family)